MTTLAFWRRPPAFPSRASLLYLGAEKKTYFPALLESNSA